MADFLRTLLNGNLLQEEALARELAWEAGFPREAEEYRCLYAFNPEKPATAAAYHEIYERLPALCERFFRHRAYSARVSPDYDGGADILLFGKYTSSMLEQLLQELLLFFSRHGLSGVRLAVGTAAGALTEICHSSAAAREAARYSAETLDTPLVFSQDIQRVYSAPTLQSSAAFEEMLGAFRAGDMARLRRQVERYAERVRAQSPQRPNGLYPTSIKRMMIELTVYALHIASDAGVDVDSYLEFKDPYTQLLAFHTTPDIIAWFIALCERLHAAMQEMNHSAESGLVARSCRYIREHLTEYDLGLDTVSAWVGVSSSYLSTVFRRETGVGFNGYISAARMALAEERLRSTPDSIEQIAAECGFGNACYFTRVFKKSYGMPPGAYRQRMRGPGR